VLIAEEKGRAIGYAIYLFTYSSFLARPTLWRTSRPSGSTMASAPKRSTAGRPTG
jgi:hypothetical protein